MLPNAVQHPVARPRHASSNNYFSILVLLPDHCVNVLERNIALVISDRSAGWMRARHALLVTDRLSVNSANGSRKPVSAKMVVSVKKLLCYSVAN